MTQRNSLGGFSSTQDTVVGLKALAAISAKWLVHGQTLKIDTICMYDDNEGDAKFSFTIDKANSVTLQSRDLAIDRQNLNSVKIKAKGTGVALIQLVIRYNLAEFDSGDFNVQSSTSGDSDDEVTSSICLR